MLEFRSREKSYEISYKGVSLPHFYYADFVVWDKILLEAKAVEKLTGSHIKQSRRVAAPRGSVDQFRWRFLEVEKGHFMTCEFHGRQ